MSDAFYLVLFAAISALMASRVYLLIATGELNVRGSICSREQTPIRYWFTLTCAILGTAVTFIIAVACLFAFFARL